MKENYNEPIYIIRVFVKLLKTCPGTLRSWEKRD